MVAQSVCLKKQSETDMPKSVTYEFEDMSDILDTLDDTVSTLQGFTDLLEFALGEVGGDLKHNAYGVARLLEQQVDALDQLRRAARIETNRLEADSPVYADGDIDAIARMAGVQKSMTARVMFVLTGKDLAGDAYKREGDFGPYRLDRHLLERRIYDTLNNSMEWGRVSQETDLPFHTVQAVFNAMLGVPVVRQSDAAPGAEHPTIDQVIDQLKGGKAIPDPDQQAANG